MDYVIVSAISVAVTLLLCEYLSIAPRRKELEYLKRGNEDDLRELYELRGKNAYLSEELEQLKAKSEDDLRKLREENESIKVERDCLSLKMCCMKIGLKKVDETLGEQKKEIKELRQQKEALEKELLERVDNQTEKSDVES